MFRNTLSALKATWSHVERRMKASRTLQNCSKADTHRPTNLEDRKFIFLRAWQSFFKDASDGKLFLKDVLNENHTCDVPQTGIREGLLYACSDLLYTWSKSIIWTWPTGTTHTRETSCGRLNVLQSVFESPWIPFCTSWESILEFIQRFETKSWKHANGGVVFYIFENLVSKQYAAETLLGDNW